MMQQFKVMLQSNPKASGALILITCLILKNKPLKPVKFIKIIAEEIRLHIYRLVISELLAHANGPIL
jgi:hypothetical protein